ncbi:hypothetical protein ADIWIN_2456 [Winogradskyella psychrotolerans RS-3]|jgi:hypothetical protein|uniref:Uncharacterized protein n=1 Tax=Winogradskyella psychrotolerans RS-3 TaxID=641526 RepID=S7VRD1_9FLAO|nr:hypothetical protein [Winogradskyella psychrotolerans]EPR72566.1 hypothetical protein ADIWIN_2456 [Winogradskyella psychrotolerans RS-3]
MRKKTKIITLRISDLDYVEIEAAAQELGVSISEYIREKSVPKYILL